MDKDKIRKIIWQSINVHFVLKDSLRLETLLKFEPNKSIAQIMAVGLSNQYNLDRAQTERLLCIEPSSYDKKLSNFLNTIKKTANDRQYNKVPDDAENFFQRYQMCSRYIRSRLKYYVETN